MSWSYDDLFDKAIVNAKRAFEGESRESELFVFWATLSLEFLGRAVLAKVHPSLLADPQSPESVLYACGVGTAANAKSIAAKTVFARCKVIVPGFSDADFGFCMMLMGRRNEELHSGLPGFEDLRLEKWLADYYRAIKKMLTHLGLDLSHMLGADDVKAAEAMILAAEKSLIAEVKKRVAAHRTIFEGLEVAAVTAKTKEAEIARRTLRKPYKPASCPACGNTCPITGELVRSTEPRLLAGLLHWEDIMLPNALNCDVCGLTLKGHESLHIVDLGGQFTIATEADPAEYYLEGVDMSRFFEPEYMNS